MKTVVLALLVGCSSKSAPAPAVWEVESYWKQAELTAHAWHEDAELVLLTADQIDARGVTTLEGAARLKFEYRSQADLAKTQAERVGVSAGRPPNCLLSLYIHDRRTQFSTGMRTGDCAGPRLGPVKCSIAQIWKRAIDKGAPASARANLELHLSGSIRRWRFVVIDRSTNQPLLDQNFDDDC